MMKIFNTVYDGSIAVNKNHIVSITFAWEHKNGNKIYCAVLVGGGKIEFAGKSLKDILEFLETDKMEYEVD